MADGEMLNKWHAIIGLWINWDFHFGHPSHGQGTPIRGSDARSSFSCHDRCSVRSGFGR